MGKGIKPAQQADTFTHARPDFRERVASLVGHSAWREPVEGRTTAVRQVPGDHMVAAALSFGRRCRPGTNEPDREDIGPDIAFDLATGTQGHAQRVCHALGRALSGDRSALVRRNRAVLAVVALAGYRAAMRLPLPERPDACSEDDWGDLVSASARILEALAEDTLALCERKARRAA